MRDERRPAAICRGKGGDGSNRGTKSIVQAQRRTDLLRILQHNPFTQTKTPPFAAGFRREEEPCGSPESGSSRDADLVFMRLAQLVAAAPDGLDEVAALGSGGELLAQLADEDVDDLQFRLVHAA